MPGASYAGMSKNARGSGAENPNNIMVDSISSALDFRWVLNQNLR